MAVGWRRCLFGFKAASFSGTELAAGLVAGCVTAGAGAAGDRAEWAGRRFNFRRRILAALAAGCRHRRVRRRIGW